MSRIASSKWWRSQTKADDGCQSFECFKGINPEILEILQPKLNFTFTITKEQVAGRKVENGSWTGQIGKLHSRSINQNMFCPVNKLNNLCLFKL